MSANKKGNLFISEVVTCAKCGATRLFNEMDPEYGKQLEEFEKQHPHEEEE